jgi:hypothetical protein
MFEISFSLACLTCSHVAHARRTSAVYGRAVEGAQACRIVSISGGGSAEHHRRAELSPSMSRGDLRLDIVFVDRAGLVRSNLTRPDDSDTVHPAADDSYYKLYTALDPARPIDVSPIVISNFFTHSSDTPSPIILAFLGRVRFSDNAAGWIEALSAATSWIARARDPGQAENLLLNISQRVEDLSADAALAKRVSLSRLG